MQKPPLQGNLSLLLGCSEAILPGLPKGPWVRALSLSIQIFGSSALSLGISRPVQTHCGLTPIAEPQAICLTLASKNTLWKGSSMHWRCEKMNPDERCGNIHMDSSSRLDEEEMNGSACNTYAFVLVPPAHRSPWHPPVTPPKDQGHECHLTEAIQAPLQTQNRFSSQRL